MRNATIDMAISRSVFLSLSLSVSAHRSALCDISFYLLIAACALKGNGKGQTPLWAETLPVCSWLLYIYLSDSEWEECELEKGCSLWFNINLNNVWSKIMLSYERRDGGSERGGRDGFRAHGRSEVYASTSDWHPLVPSVKTIFSGNNPRLSFCVICCFFFPFPCTFLFLDSPDWLYFLNNSSFHLFLSAPLLFSPQWGQADCFRWLHFIIRHLCGSAFSPCSVLFLRSPCSKTY